MDRKKFVLLQVVFTAVAIAAFGLTYDVTGKWNDAIVAFYTATVLSVAVAIVAVFICTSYRFVSAFLVVIAYFTTAHVVIGITNVHITVFFKSIFSVIGLIAIFAVLVVTTAFVAIVQELKERWWKVFTFSLGGLLLEFSVMCGVIMPFKPGVRFMTVFLPTLATGAAGVVLILACFISLSRWRLIRQIRSLKREKITLDKQIDEAQEQMAYRYFPLAFAPLCNRRQEVVDKLTALQEELSPPAA
ncbi:MAG TPA: hypothetical protein VFQ60_05240 [Patescibacteria group bacterium]|nr:hypothetical protein [Patescibacteria group bacterium]